jgi:hypothetical protein
MALACMVHQDAAHDLSGDPEKLRAIHPRHPALSHQAHIGFVHEGRRLERVIRPLATEVRDGSLAQLVIDERDKFVTRLEIPNPPLPEQLTDPACIGHHHEMPFRVAAPVYIPRADAWAGRQWCRDYRRLVLPPGPLPSNE